MLGVVDHCSIAIYHFVLSVISRTAVQLSLRAIWVFLTGVVRYFARNVPPYSSKLIGTLKLRAHRPTFNKEFPFGFDGFRHGHARNR